MHSDDVAELVAEEFSQFVERAEDVGGLDHERIKLVDRTKIYVPFEVTHSESELVAVGPALLLPGGGARQESRHIPILGRSVTRDLVLHLDCRDFDGQPPTAELLRPDRDPLPPEQWPKDPTARGIVTGHPNYARPFFCRPELREYHEHPQHEDDPWDKHREGMSLCSLILGLLHDLRHRWMLR